MENGAPQTSSTENATPAAPSAGVASPTPPSASNGAPATSTPAAPVATSTPAHAAPVDRTPTRKLLTGDDDAIPDDADAFEISKQAFKKRLERYSRTQLKQLFGTDNPEEILAWKQQNEAFQKQQEEQRLAQMSEAERFKVQFEKASQDANYWKTQFETLQESHAIREQDRQMTGIAQKHVNPKCMNFLMMEFATHLQGVDEKEIGDAQAYADSWFANYVKENPEFGIPSAAPAAAPPAAVPGATPAAPVAAAPRQVQVPITNGPSVGRPQNAVPTGALAQKTLAPGRPNSMSDDEAKRWMREHGYTF